MKQNCRQDKKVSRHLRQGKVTRVKIEQSERTRQWKLKVQIHNIFHPKFCFLPVTFLFLSQFPPNLGNFPKI